MSCPLLGVIVYRIAGRVVFITNSERHRELTQQNPPIMKEMKAELDGLLALFEERQYEEAASACQVAMEGISDTETRSAVHDLML